MTAQTLDGKATARAIKADLTERVAKLREQGVVPGLGTVLVGDDPGSHSYVAGKHRDCAQVGIESIQVELPGSATQETVDAAVHQLNADPGAPATSCSCRCPPDSTRTTCWSSWTPPRTPTVCTP